MDIDTNKKEKMIMVVEDDKNINELISYDFFKNGFASESVYDGMEAQSRLLKEVFDMVILYIMLPSIYGFHICKAIKENPAAFKTFVVVLTARAESQDKTCGNIVGTDYYITKLFSASKLIELIKELIVIRDKGYVVKMDNAIHNSAQGRVS
jgi:DNA-binding response OmpR family regulator